MSASATADRSVQPRLIFRAGKRRYAVPTSKIREIASLPHVTPVPLAPRQLLGLGSVRGETLAIVTPDRALPDKSGQRPRQLLVIEGPHRIGLAVDRVEGIEGRGAGPAARRSRTIELPLDEIIAEAFVTRETARRSATVNSDTGRASEADQQVPLLRFQVGEQHFALAMDQVVQVLVVPADIARLPGVDAAVVGTIAWSEGTLGVLSASVLLRLASETDVSQRAARVIVTSIAGHRLGLLVDRVDGLLRIAPERIDPVSPTLLRGDSEARITAICRPPGGGQLISILAADHLLSEARTRRLHLTRADRRQTAVVTARSATLPLLPIDVGPHRLALPVDAVEQVVRRPAEITPISHAPAWLIGVALISGHPLIIVDQVLRLTGTPAHGLRERLLIVRIGKERLGLLVSGVRAILHASRLDLVHAPLDNALAAGIFGETLQLPDEGGTLLVLEPSALLSSAEGDLIAHVSSGSDTRRA